MHVCLLHTCFSAGCLLCFLLPSSSAGEQQLLSGPAAKACGSEESASPLGKALSFGSPPVMERKRGAWWRAPGTQRDGIWWGWGFGREGRGLGFSSQPTSEGVSLQGHVGLAPAGALGYNSCEWQLEVWRASSQPSPQIQHPTKPFADGATWLAMSPSSIPACLLSL